MDPLVIIILIFVIIPVVGVALNQNLDATIQAKKNAKEMKKMLDERDKKQM